MPLCTGLRYLCIVSNASFVALWEPVEILKAVPLHLLETIFLDMVVRSESFLNTTYFGCQKFDQYLANFPRRVHLRITFTSDSCTTEQLEIAVAVIRSELPLTDERQRLEIRADQSYQPADDWGPVWRE